MHPLVVTIKSELANALRSGTHKEVYLIQNNCVCAVVKLDDLKWNNNALTSIQTSTLKSTSLLQSLYPPVITPDAFDYDRG